MKREDRLDEREDPQPLAGAGSSLDEREQPLAEAHRMQPLMRIVAREDSSDSFQAMGQVCESINFYPCCDEVTSPAVSSNLSAGAPVLVQENNATNLPPLLRGDFASLALGIGSLQRAISAPSKDSPPDEAMKSRRSTSEEPSAKRVRQSSHVLGGMFSGDSTNDGSANSLSSLSCTVDVVHHTSDHAFPCVQSAHDWAAASSSDGGGASASASVALGSAGGGVGIDMVHEDPLSLPLTIHQLSLPLTIRVPQGGSEFSGFPPSWLQDAD